MQPPPRRSGAGMRGRHARAGLPLGAVLVAVAVVVAASATVFALTRHGRPLLPDASELPGPSASVAPTPAPTPLITPSPSAPHLKTPGPIPGYLLIADRGNDRMLLVNSRKDILWVYPRPGT